MADPETHELTLKDRRSGLDRRAGPTSPFSRQSLFGSRKGGRRKEDRKKNYFVDVYSPLLMLVLVFTLILSITDAFLTLRLMEDSFRELNPIMDFFLRQGPYVFLLVKYSLTSFGLITLLVCNTFTLFGGRIRAVYLLGGFLGYYMALIGYEILLILHLGK
jgi:hypothetical protein